MGKAHGLSISYGTTPIFFAAQSASREFVDYHGRGRLQCAALPFSSVPRLNSHGVAGPRRPHSREWIGSYSAVLDFRCPVNLRDIRFHVGNTFRTSRRNPYCSNRRSGDFILVLQERPETLQGCIQRMCSTPYHLAGSSLNVCRWGFQSALR